MQTTPKSKLKTVSTVLVAVILMVSGLVILFTTKAAPEPDRPIITSERLAR